jgi:hypothetical protein
MTVRKIDSKYRYQIESDNYTPKDTIWAY